MSQNPNDPTAQLEALRKQVRELGEAVKQGLEGAKESLSKRAKGSDEPGDKHLQQNEAVLDAVLSALADLERDVDACLGATSRPGCSCEELCERYRAIYEVVQEYTTTVASSPGLGECPC